MANFEAYQEYQRIEDFEEDSPPGEEDLLVHVPEGLKDSWHHIKNLDNFFTRIYHFHQKNGFACMMLSEFFELVQLLFVVTFTTFLVNCVEYDVLFANRAVNHTGSGQNPLDRNKVTLPDAILPGPECTQRSFIPDEHMVWCPEQLLQCMLAHIHYMPDHWRGNANKSETRDEVAQLFQYKAVFILEELLSPIVTPFILIFILRNKSLEIIDFFRNFTVEVVGVGDICSFAQMDIRRHGNPTWMSEGQTEASVYQQAENGKTELSLMHFTIKNPRWQPPQESSVFISHLKEKVQHDAQSGPSTQLLLSEAPLCTSLESNGSATVPDNLLASVLAHPILTASGLQGRDHHFIPPSTTASAAASVLASLSTSQLAHTSRGRSPGLLPSSVHPESTMYRSDRTIIDSMTNSDSRIQRNALHSEFASAEMSLHAIYMHELHQQSSHPQRTSGQWQNSVPMRDLHTNTGFQGHSDLGSSISVPTTVQLGGWQEEEEEENEDEQEINSGSTPKQGT
nr:PREDICTED: autophagy-related protein 9A-like [Paralichthys olivaceus]